MANKQKQAKKQRKTEDMYYNNPIQATELPSILYIERVWNAEVLTHERQLVLSAETSQLAFNNFTDMAIKLGFDLKNKQKKYKEMPILGPLFKAIKGEKEGMHNEISN